MKTRAWATLADTLVFLLLVGSLVLFYLYPKPSQKTTQTSPKENEIVFYPLPSISTT